MPRLVLHVGIHKTATSTIQAALTTLRPQLRRHGVAYLSHKQLKRLPHARAWAARRTRSRFLSPLFQDELRALVEKEIIATEQKSGGRASTVLISSEHMLGARMPGEEDAPVFRPFTEAAIGEVISGLRGDEVHIALYTRRQDRLMESAYLWEIQKGLSHDIREQFPFIDEPVLSFDRLADRIAGIPAVTSVRVRPFELIGSGSIPYVDDFLENVDLSGKLDYSKFVEDPSVNVSYSQKALDVALKVNPHLDDERQRGAFKRFLKQQFPTSQYPSVSVFSDQERLALLSLYSADNARLFERWMPDLPVDSYSTIAATGSLDSVLAKVGSQSRSG